MSFISIHAHIVFATKYREKQILPQWRDKLHEYLGGITKGLRRTTHKEELIEMLDKAGIEYDSKYLD